MLIAFSANGRERIAPFVWVSRGATEWFFRWGPGYRALPAEAHNRRNSAALHCSGCAAPYEKCMRHWVMGVQAPVGRDKRSALRRTPCVEHQGDGVVGPGKRCCDGF